MPGHTVKIKRDQSVVSVREVVGQCACKRLDEVIAPVLTQLHIDDAYFQHVARLSPVDCDRPGQDMPGQHSFGPLVEVQQFWRYVKSAGR